MSFQLDLDETPIAVLVGEIMKRKERVETGRCPYCNAEVTYDGATGKRTCTCRFGSVDDNQRQYNAAALNPLFTR